MTVPAVEVEALVKRYGAVTAVDGLSFTAPAGRVTAVLGPNGAGKTTTVETCEGYRRPDSGRVRVLGRDPWADARSLRERVGVMLQQGGVYGAVRPDEALRHAASLYAQAYHPDGLLERLGLVPVRRTAFRRLSGGQQQRLLLALAVVGRPELVFLDEPTSGLDPQARHATWELVEQLRATGTSVVLTTHLMEEAERLADHVVIVDHGRVVAAGTTAELVGGAGDTLRFRARPGLDIAPLLAALPAGCVGDEDRPGSYRVEGPLGPAELASVSAWCAAQGVVPERLTVGRRSLEDVFLDLTGRELRT